MATYTTNYNLSKPEPTDTHQNFIEDYCGNMNIIDQNMGGGGHVIIDENGTDVPQEPSIQFIGNVNVTDDAQNRKTVVEIAGGGGGAVEDVEVNGTSVVNQQGVAEIIMPSEIDDLSDVNISNPSNNQILGYNSNTQKWENINQSGGSVSALSYHQYTEIEYNGLTPAEKNNGVIYFISENSVGAEGLVIIKISETDYENLTPAQKNNNIPYFVY